MLKIFFAIILATAAVQAQTVRTTASVDTSNVPRPADRLAANSNEPNFEGKPLSFWLNSLRNRDGQIDKAFEAIRKLGPQAEAAVPELTRIISEPFDPIEVGVEGRTSGAAKVRELEFRSRAVD